MEAVVVDSVVVVSAEGVPSVLAELELNSRVVLVVEASGTEVVTLLAVLVVDEEYPASVELVVLEMRLLISGSTEGFVELTVVLSTLSVGLILQTPDKLRGIKAVLMSLIWSWQIPLTD